MHPVTTCFLEDIYESTGYHLASDSPAAIRYEVSSGKKVSGNMVPILLGQYRSSSLQHQSLQTWHRELLLSA